MVKSLKLRTVDNTERFDPVRNLWRNVLIVALEDAIKKRKYMDGNYVSKYNSLIRASAIDYFLEPNSDFALVCQYAGFDHLTVRRKVYKHLERMSNDEKENMTKVLRQRIFQSQDIGR